jgi:hypothetical protein
MEQRTNSIFSGRWLPAKHSESLLAAATNYVARGWPVIPLEGKLPKLCWKEFQSRMPTPAELHAWFSDGLDPPTGLGVVTGKLSGLVVIDCDSKQDAAFWQAEHGSSPLVAATGGGGIHIYYAMPGEVEVRNRARLFGRKIDIRGEGGYVAVPPSLHPSGACYEWLQFGVRDPLSEFAPSWILEGHQERTLPRTKQTIKVRNAWAYLRCIRAVAGEGGHNATFRAACRLRDSGLSVGEALDLLSAWNETNSSPPWSARELEHKIRTAFGC